MYVRLSILFHSSLIQLFGVEPFKTYIFKLYVIDSLAPILYANKIRVPGIFPAFADHCFFLVFFCLLSFLCLRAKVISSNFYLLIFLVCSLLFILAQSRTAFVALVFASLVVFFYRNLLKFRVKSIFKFIIGVSLAGAIIIFYLSNVNSGVLYHLSSIFYHGLSSGSMDARLSKWTSFLELFNSPLNLLFGVNREIVGAEVVVFDNDFIFSVISLGLPVTLFLYGYLLIISFNIKRLDSILGYLSIFWIVFLVVCGLGVISISMPFGLGLIGAWFGLVFSYSRCILR